MMKTVLITVLALHLSTCKVQSARILGIFSFPGKSQYILGSSLMRALAEDGHDVTVISPFGERDPPKGGNYRDILIPELNEIFKKDNESTNVFEMGDMGPFVAIPFVASYASDAGKLVLAAKNVQELINSDEKFDAVIIDQFYNDALKSLATHFGGAQIVLSSLAPNFWVNPLVANPSPLAYIPDTFLSYSPRMTFCERLTNTLVYIVNLATHHFYLHPKHNSLIREYIPNAPAISDVLYNASLVLLNSHPSFNQAVPHVPNMIEIGGFHIKPPKELPNDLQEYLDSAKDGVVYFSMGSNLKSSELPPEKRDAIIKTFAKLKQKVLWKWEEDTLQPPSNVKLGKWLPQQAILAHPNIKLFITHGGLLSTTETIYFGVPILTIPIYGDQKLNAQTAVDGGFGLTLSYQELNEDSLTAKISEMLRNFKYGVNAKKKSSVFHDRLVKPLDEAIYWVNYVIRHQGAPHLRVTGVSLPWYQYFLVDVIVVITAFSALALIINYVILKKICKRFCSKNSGRKVKLN